MALDINESNFAEEVLNSDIPVLVDFWAEWCMPCKMVAPTVEEISTEFSGKLKVCKVNVDEANELAGKYEIMSIPTLAIFKEGEIIEKIIGALPKDAIVAKLNPHIDN